MRKFRNATIAAATAVSLTFAGTTIASAQDGDDVQEESSVRLSSGSSALGHDLGAWDEQEENDDHVPGDEGDPVIRDENQVTGGNLLGSVTADSNPEWAESWKDWTALGAVGAVVGAIIGGINWLKFQGILPY